MKQTEESSPWQAAHLETPAPAGPASPAASIPAGAEQRPWGWHQTLAEGHRYRVKRLQLWPGRRISLQRHHHRCEHWVVVEGSGTAWVAEATVPLTPGREVFIPRGTLHRAAAAAAGLVIIEVQRGGTLREDDIERFADDFGRA
jgi:mannose-6-phosphate isomerase-like protein (cupin superfamily)